MRLGVKGNKLWPQYVHTKYKVVPTKYEFMTTKNEFVPRKDINLLPQNTNFFKKNY